VLFINPLLLAGILAVASPIIIHLLARKQIKKVVWAAMRFLQASVARNQHRMDLEDIILLILRCALLVLLALALARPSFKKGGFGSFQSGGGVAAVLLLDNSGSMAQTDGAVSAFQNARTAGEAVLDALPNGSSAAVWLVSDLVKGVIPEPSRDFALARKAVRQAQRSDRSTDLQPALRQAIDVLKRQKAPGKEIYLVTDGQATGWKQVSETRAMLDSVKTDVKTHLILVGEGESRNLGVTGLRLSSALAPVDEPLRFEVEVANYGIEEAKNIPVSLAIDGEPPGDEQTLESIPAGEARRISLFIRFRTAGFHAVTAHIQADRDPADDQRVIAVRATGEVNVLLVDGDPGAEPRDSEVFYLRNALMPVPPEERDKYFIKAKSVTAAEFESAKLGDYEAVVLADVPEFSDAALDALTRYVRNGGGLIVFPGARMHTPFYNQKLQVERGLLPAAFGEAHGDADQQDKVFHLQSKGYEHPIVDIWKDPAAGNLGTAQFFRAYTLLPGKKSDVPGNAGPAATVLSYADGLPAVLEHTWGFGRVVQFSSSANAAWNDLCVRPVYVPLIHRVLGSLLARQDERLNLRVGSKLTYVMDAELVGKDVTVTKPGGGKDISGVRRITINNGVPLLEYDETDLAGAYDVRSGAADTPPLLRFATQADPDESKLAELSATDLKSFESVADVIHWTSGAGIHSSLQRELTGTEFWLPFAVLGLCCAVAETVLGNRWSRSR
jgi:von Willebrand factor type A domain/Aerotolerance regulator N-terminal